MVAEEKIQKPTISIYDPRPVQTEEEKAASSIIWTSQSVEWALDMIKLGQTPKHSPFFEKNIFLRKGDIVFHYTEKERLEILKCKRNIIYFIEKYCKVKTDKGKIENIALRKYQINQIKDFLENDEIILGWSRQSGKTIGTSIFIIWCMLFNSDKQTAILANKGATSGEVLTKIKDIYKNLPFFLKAGILGWNGGTISFDNGCKVYTGPTTPDALNGRTCNILYIDEFAFVGQGKNKIEKQKDFLANAIPVLSSQKNSGMCKLIISSTPLGKEYFYELFDNALKKKNKMKASKVCWWEIPGKDLKWAKDEIAKIGITKFKQQYEMSFNVHAKTLLNAKTMRKLTRFKKNFKSGEYDILSNYEEFLYFDKDLELFENDVYCLAVDIAEGLGQDYSVIQILRLEGIDKNNDGIFKQIGYWSSNEIPIEEFVDVVGELFMYFNPEYSKLLVESNTYGDYFFKCLQADETYDIPLESICKSKRTAESKIMTRGIRTNSQIKKIGVSSFKKLVDTELLEICSEETIKEIENFQEDEKGNYKASIGHDDQVTPLVNFCYWVTQSSIEYKSWIEAYMDLNEYDTSYDIEEEIDINSLTEEEKFFL